MSPLKSNAKRDREEREECECHLFWRQQIFRSAGREALPHHFRKTHLFVLLREAVFNQGITVAA